MAFPRVPVVHDVLDVVGGVLHPVLGGLGLVPNATLEQADVAARRQRRQVEDLLAEREKMEADFAAKIAALEAGNEEEDKRFRMEETRRRRLAAQRGFGGRGSTILTDNLGQLGGGDSTLASKTLLGL